MTQSPSSTMGHDEPQGRRAIGAAGRQGATSSGAASAGATSSGATSSGATSSSRAAVDAVRDGAPRPAAAYLAASASLAHHAALLSAHASDPRFPWRPGLRADAAERAAAFAGSEAGDIRKAVLAEATQALTALADGIERYRAAPPRQRPPPAPTIWRAGGARLLDYSAFDAENRGPTLLALPSLINRARILDLTASRSMMRGLARRGVRPLLLDWGEPGPEERGFDLEDYVMKRALPAFDAAAAEAARRGDGRVAVLGHCMSGPLALATAQIAESRSGAASPSRVCVMGAPWRFEYYRQAAPQIPPRDLVARLVNACGAVFGGLPKDILNTLFFLRDPLQALRKFPSFGDLDMASARARLFVAVEDWLNDGVLLVENAARTLLLDWAYDDRLAGGGWRVADTPIRPSQLRAPVLAIASKSDTLAPYASATGLFADAPQAQLLRPTSGHVGMIVGGRAETELWDPLAAWAKN